MQPCVEWLADVDMAGSRKKVVLRHPQVQHGMPHTEMVPNPFLADCERYWMPQATYLDDSNSLCHGFLHLELVLAEPGTEALCIALLQWLLQAWSLNEVFPPVIHLPCCDTWHPRDADTALEGRVGLF